VPKRPRFSRWRRLPPVFRSGEHRPPDQGNELDRIILYVPAAILDLAEKLAEKEGAASVQEYCSQLLIKGVEDAKVRHKVADFEARRGPLEGLKEIASDPDYLAEWRERQARKQEALTEAETGGCKPGDTASDGGIIFVDGPAEPGIEDGRTDQHPEVAAGAGIKLGSDSELSPVGDSEPLPVRDRDLLRVRDNEPLRPRDNEPLQVRIEMVDRTVPKVALKPTVLLMSNESALEILGRHVGWVQDDWGFLPCLRRGEAVPTGRVTELARALAQLEDELRGAELLDRRTAHALHRLALESQVLLTDAWPGVFDDNAVTAIRTIQEAVERILSGEDIRYYPAPEEPASERPH
jgi:hypothetical protein